MEKVYSIENLDCANCAAKAEAKIRKIPGIEAASITFATMQLRLHCAYMGFPILGDPQYGTPQSQAFAPELTGQQLCAKRLEFRHPITAKPLILESKMDVQV